MTGEPSREPTLPSSTPVLVAGGGPVGLALAVELAHHGVPCVVIERRKDVSWLRPRAKTTSARTMEHFRRWGLADTVRSQAPLPVTWSDEAVFCTRLLGREITRFDRCFGLELLGSDVVAECGQQVPQPVIEQVLREAVNKSPLARLYTQMTVTGVQETSDGAVARMVDAAGREHQIQADYVVGCEGANSVVREAIGARYEGSADSRPNFNIVFRATGLAERVPHGPAVHYWILNPDQPGLIGRMDLADTWWCIAQGVTTTDGEANPETIIRNLVGADQQVRVLATDAWRARMLLADRYSSHRLFIAGDAAHQNPPWGGHGFNTGIGDAVNLGWKLAAVINAWAPPQILASYEAERRPVAARTIAEAARNMGTLAADLTDPKLAGDQDEFDRIRPAVAAAIHRSKDNEFHSLNLTLGYDYQGSPIVATEPDTSPPPARIGDYTPTAAAGHRLPHRWLATGESLYDRLGAGYTLIGEVDSPAGLGLAAAAATLGIPLEVVGLDGPQWHELFRAPLALVRPDQHVAWRGAHTDDPAGVIRRAVGTTVGALRPVTARRERIGS
jgi:2-polyprenyl-6-methoxyphenol hydroxylase-like FAD-dependent oxidoreductase